MSGRNRADRASANPSVRDDVSIRGVFDVVVRDLSGDVVERQRVANVTCVGLHEDLVDAIDPSQDATLGADLLAVGDDDSTSPSTSDTALNNKIGETGITTGDDEGTALYLSTFIDSSQLNGETFREVGIVSQNGKLWNHALLSTPVDKTSTKTVTVDVTLDFSG